MSAQQRLWSDRVDAQADLSLCWAHSHFVGFVMRRLKYLHFRRLQNNHIFFENSEIPWLFSFLPYIPDWNQNSQTFPLGKKINKYLVSGNIWIFFRVGKADLKKNMFGITRPTQKKCPLPQKSYWPSRRRFFLFPVLRFSFCISSKFPFKKASVYTLNVPL